MAIYSQSGYVLKYGNYISIKLFSYLLCRKHGTLWKKVLLSCSDFAGYGNSLSNIITFLLSYTELITLHLNWQSGFWRAFICFSKHLKCYHSKHCVHRIINIFSFKVVCFFFFQFVLMLNGKLENCFWVRQEIKCAFIKFWSKIRLAGMSPKLNATAKAMANRNVYPNCILIILSSCYIRFIIIFQIFNFVLAFSTFSVAFLFCLLQTSFWKSSRKAFQYTWVDHAGSLPDLT